MIFWWQGQPQPAMQSKNADVSKGVRIHLRTLSVGNGCEYYISALPEDCCTSLDVSGQADLVYAAIANILNDGRARILNERIFASLDAFEAADKVRSRLLWRQAELAHRWYR